MTYRDPNQVDLASPIEQLYSDWSDPTPTEPTPEMTASEKVGQLEVITDELTTANLKAQTLLTDFGSWVENCEMDGVEPQAAFDEAERQQLRNAIIATREALRALTELEETDV